MLKVSVYRYNPDTDKEPYMKDYQLDTEGKDLMVLDILELLSSQAAGLKKELISAIWVQTYNKNGILDRKYALFSYIPPKL